MKGRLQKAVGFLHSSEACSLIMVTALVALARGLSPLKGLSSYTQKLGPTLFPFNYSYNVGGAFPGSTSGKEFACQCKRCKETRVRSLGWEDSPEEGMATHSSIPA